MSNLARTRQPLDIRLDSLNLEKSVELAKSEPAKAGDVIMALIAQNTDALPDTAFVRRQDGAFLKKIKSGVTLRESDGTLVKIGSKKVGSAFVPVYDLSINGYRKLNEVTSLQVIRPENVIVDGTTQMNPYIQVNTETRMPEVVYARCLAVGYSPFGSLCATDVMVRLDINIYLLENFQAKMKRAAEGVRDQIGMYGANDDPPVDAKGVKLGGYRFFPIHSVGGLGLWINYRNPVIQEVLGDHTTRLKFVERLAQSFAERNALKAHPAIPKGVKSDNGIAYVRCTGWTTDFTRDDIKRLQDLVAGDRLNEFRDGDGSTIDVQAREVRSMDEGDREAMEQVAIEEQEHERRERREAGIDGEEEEGEETTAVASEAETDLLAEATDAYARLVEMKGRAGARKVLAELQIKNLEETKIDDLKRFLEKAKEIEAS